MIWRKRYLYVYLKIIMPVQKCIGIFASILLKSKYKHITVQTDRNGEVHKWEEKSSFWVQQDQSEHRHLML